MNLQQALARAEEAAQKWKDAQRESMRCSEELAEALSTLSAALLIERAKEENRHA